MLDSKNKKYAGLTLVELIIAVGILTFGVSGVVTVLHVGFRQSRIANQVTQASIEAQLQMESLVGRRWMHPDINMFPLNLTGVTPALVGWDGTAYVGFNTPFQRNDFWIVLKYEPVAAQAGHSINTDAMGLLDINGLPITGAPACTAIVAGNPCTDCLPHLITMRFSVFVYPDLQSAVDEENLIIIHSNIMNVHPDGAIF